jgi:hypothetical protein
VHQGKTSDNKTKMLTTEQREFVVGFNDGDGSVLMNGRYVRIEIGQSCDAGQPPELVHVQRYYGGSIRDRGVIPGKRRAWILVIADRMQVLPLLEDIVRFGIMKAPQARLALEFLRSDGKTPELYGAALSRGKLEYESVPIDPAKLTNAYLAGFFAADGSVGFYGNAKSDLFLSVGLGKKSCPALLRAIREKLGHGYVGKGLLHLKCNGAMQFLSQIQEHVVGQKRPQVDVAIDFQSKRPRGGKRTAEQRDKEKDVARKLKVMKKM